MTTNSIRPARFGSVLGIAPGGVEAYSCDYDSADEDAYPNRRAFRHYIDSVYIGYKWQCVEFARRWLYVNKGYIFDDVSMAYEIFNLRWVRDLRRNERLPFQAFRNGSMRHPEPGCLLIWDEGEQFEETGHVAIVTEVLADRIRVAEQNVDNLVWPDDRDYAREIRCKIGDLGDFWVESPFDEATVLGWMIQTDDTNDAEPTSDPDRRLLNLQSVQTDLHGQSEKPWLNIANDDEAAYVEMMGGHQLTSNRADQYHYFLTSATALEGLERATDELHGMFMHATDYVLEHDELLSRFRLPNSVLTKIRQSWDNRRNELITSRFDFSLSERGLKVYEYNCDSASCYMETGKVQGKWAQHFGAHRGADAGQPLFSKLVDAWRKSQVNGLVHVLHDDDPEEKYHALFMQSAIEAADLPCRILCGLDSLRWDAAGDIVDDAGNRVRWVWKTWAWETALDQLRAEFEADAQNAVFEPTARLDTTPRLVDVLLRKHIMVFEPLWTLIPSNKAIMPVLWSLFPQHPFLLNTSFELTEELRTTGYACKPIVGRCGANIEIRNEAEKLIADTGGQFADRSQVYQELFPLPRLGDYFVQVSTFTARGNYAGSIVRVDPSMIIGKDSDCMALRVDDDSSFL